MKRFLFTALTALTLLFGAGPLAVPAYAESVDSGKAEVCKSLRTEAGAACGAGATQLRDIFRAVLNILSIIAGLAAVIMIIVSGIKYITSNGDSNAVGGAKKTLIYAIIGLIIVAFAQSIVFFVLGKVI